VRRAAALALLLPLSAAALTAQDPATRFATRVDAYLKSEMTRQGLVGLSVAVMREGKVVLERGYGFANLEHQAPATPATVYQSGSLGKQFTAAGIMLLVQDGKLRLEDSVPWFFPEAPAAWNAVTVRHLLTHTSGAGDYPDDFDYRHDYTESEMRALVLSLPFTFTPGSDWQYSNMGYVLLGLIIREVTGQFYGDVLQARIFRPLGMSTTRIITEADLVLNRAAGYRRVNGGIRNQEWVSPVVNTTADGALYLTVRDLARWDAALYGTTLLSGESLAAIRTPVRLTDGSTRPYGFGWRAGTANGHAVMAHGGSWQGFRTAIVRYPDDRVTVAVLANLAEADPGTIAQGIAALWDPALVPLDE
jgi:CubicO group peptidase (beta-lactamase class C family)